jgi:hypothetical protein
LKEFTLDEIEMLAECDCRDELENLVQENVLQFDGQIYTYCPNNKILFFELNQKPEIKIGQRITFEQAASQYMMSRTLSKATVRSYKSRLKFHIRPYFQDIF